MKPVKTWTEGIHFGQGIPATVQNIDDDADYRPILQGLINTRCNYDGAKIEGSLEE
jgi:hypothetical protein